MTVCYDVYFSSHEITPKDGTWKLAPKTTLSLYKISQISIPLGVEKGLMSFFKILLSFPKPSLYKIEIA